MTKSYHKKTFVSISLLFLIAGVFGQSNKKIADLKKVLQSSDSIVLIKHKTTCDYMPMIISDIEVADTSIDGVKKLKEKRQSCRLLKNGKINSDISINSKVISSEIKLQLIKILTTPKLSKNNEDEFKNLPLTTQTIAIYAKNKLQYIDIDFAGKQLFCSQNIHISEKDFDIDKWNKLESIFVKLDLIDKVE